MGKYTIFEKWGVNLNIVTSGISKKKANEIIEKLKDKSDAYTKYYIGKEIE